MQSTEKLEIFLSTVPGLEPVLIEEVREKGFKSANLEQGGVTVRGTWRDVWRANLELRGASRVLVRLGSFKVLHLAKLDKLANSFPWTDTLNPNTPVRVEVSCHKSRIYHSKAAAERIENAIKTQAGCAISPDATICIKVRIVKDVCTISVDTSGEGLHKRGHKQAVNKAPLRETLAALMLRKCGYTGDEPVLDPMCGSGTFVIEAAEIAAGLFPGRARSFAFEKLATFDQKAWSEMKKAQKPNETGITFLGFDRDKGAAQMSTANAVRAGVNSHTKFDSQSISALTPPEGPTGLIVVNPPYGGRIGDIKKLTALYQILGETLKTRFKGWRVGILTNSDDLAKATGLKFKKKKLGFSHGGISVKLYQTANL